MAANGTRVTSMLGSAKARQHVASCLRKQTRLWRKPKSRRWLKED
jgi:hypothetical protein